MAGPFGQKLQVLHLRAAVSLSKRMHVIHVAQDDGCLP
jgi:hypothetical protein